MSARVALCCVQELAAVPRQLTHLVTWQHAPAARLSSRDTHRVAAKTVRFRSTGNGRGPITQYTCLTQPASKAYLPSKLLTLASMPSNIINPGTLANRRKDAAYVAHLRTRPTQRHRLSTYCGRTHGCTQSTWRCPLRLWSRCAGSAWGTVHSCAVGVLGGAASLAWLTSTSPV